jgi:hypothetical protein
MARRRREEVSRGPVVTPAADDVRWRFPVFCHECKAGPLSGALICAACLPAVLACHARSRGVA